MDKQLKWALIIFFTIASICALYTSKVGMEELEKHGVIIKAMVDSKAYVKGTYTYNITFKYKNKLYDNSCRSSTLLLSRGDSVNIKISSKNPGGYCITAE